MRKDKEYALKQQDADYKKLKKYGYICLTCGKTISKGVNKDGECLECSK